MGRRIAVAALVASWIAVLIVLAPFLFDGRGSPAAATIQPPTPESGPAEGRQIAPPAGSAGEVSIGWAGDITPGSRYGQPPENGRALFHKVRPWVAQPDLAIGNLEGTFSVGGASKCGADGGQCFSFQAPPQNAESLKWAGLDLLNLANNHSFDFGAAGQQQTVAALDRHALKHTGRPGEIAVVERRGIRIAAVGFAPYPWATDVRDLDAVRELVRRAGRKADVVVVLAHLGGEGTGASRVPVGREVAMGEDRGDTRAFAHAAVDAGADLVLGSGPHVLRGIEFHRGKLIAHSLGNFAGWHNFSTSGTLALSGFLHVRLSRRGHVRGGRFTALRLDSAGAPSADGSGAATRFVNDLSRQDFGAAGLRTLRDGSY